MNDPSEKREFRRYPVDIDLEVSGRNIGDQTFREYPRIHDISGEGLRFSSQNASNFYLEQPLDIIISLPGTDTVKAIMKSNGKVVRMDSSELPDDSSEGEVTSISVKLAIPLGFTRIGDDAP